MCPGPEGATSADATRALLVGLPDTIVVRCDEDLRCVLFDGGLVDDLGLDRDDFEGRLVSEFPPLVEDDRLIGPMHRALAGERSSVDLRSRIGGRVYQASIAPFREAGVITGVICSLHDVTARLERESERSFLASVVEQSRDAIIVKNAEGVITAWNRGAEALYGYSAAEVEGKPIAILVPPERHGEDRVLLSRAMSGQPVRQYETSRIRKDGSRVEVSISLSPYCAPDGTVVGASVIARDITERITEERARRAAEEQLRVTIEHAPIGVGLIHLRGNRRGRLFSANHAMTHILGISAEESAGIDLGSLLYLDDVPELETALELLALDRIRRHELEVRVTGADGQSTWLLLAIASVPTTPGADRDNAVIHVMDIGDRKRFEGQLQHLADHDALTGLYNRQRFETELNRAVAESDRYGTACALLMIDLDGFKYVNDSLGHSYGDELVAKVGRLLRHSLRETDVVARIGGDEFAAIISHADQEQALVVCQKILSALKDGPIMLSDRRHARMTASVGLTTFDGTPRCTAEELMIEADIAMYQAKETGKNRVAIYSREDEAHTKMVQRDNWLTRIRSAIADDAFELLAQPIRGIRVEEVEHFELLLRMRGDDGVLIAPGTFLYNAERFDLIQEIDRLVFRRAVRLLAAAHRSGHDVALSVNMSGKTLGDPEILNDVEQILADCPVPRDRLIVEVTETAAITGIDRAREVASGLRRLGCRFALDDFGAGFASFYYLKHLEFDYLKIDGEFVKNLTKSTTDQLVIKSVVDIARGLGARTIAECVRDDESLHQLDLLGVDFGQGYHLGPPGPLELALPSSVA